MPAYYPVLPLPDRSSSSLSLSLLVSEIGDLIWVSEMLSNSCVF